MDITSKCPACEEEASYGINLGNLLGTLQKGKYDEPLNLQDLSFKFKPLAYKQINKINQVQFENNFNAFYRLAEVTVGHLSGSFHRYKV